MEILFLTLSTMKKIILTLTLVAIAFYCYESPLRDRRSHLAKPQASFLEAFAFIKGHEGHYANDVSDRGGETYTGITRKWNRDWKGWKFIDQAKPLRQNDSVGGLVPHYVLDYYLTIWVREGFYMIRDQQVANYVMDFRLNGTIGTMITKRVMREMGAKIVVNNVMDEATCIQMNRLDKKEFLKRLSNRRVQFYQNVARRDPSQKKFLNHWLYRARRVQV